jgi:hypothetical protein
MGTREVLVSPKHIPEALDLIKTIKIELSRVMSTQVVHKTFLDTDELLIQSNNTDPWTPFDIQSSIPAAVNHQITKHHLQESRPKRARHSTKPGTISYSSYYDAVTKGAIDECPSCDKYSITIPTTESTTSHPSHITVDTSTVSDKQAHTISDTLAKLQHELLELKSTISSIDNKMEQYNNNKTDEINLSEKQCNQRIDLLQANNQLSLQDLSQKFLEQMQLQQNSNTTLLISLLAKQEESILSKINHPATPMDDNNDDTHRSPTRKKPSTLNNSSLPQPSLSPVNTCTDILMTTAQTTQAHSAKTLINPYMPNSMRRRSVHNTLPTTTN